MTPKQACAEAAAKIVPSGKTIGLGTGSTAELFVQALAKEVSAGRVHDIVGVPTSRRTARLAQELGIPLVAEGEVPPIEVTFDGADEVDPAGNLIKGGGGSLLREKIVAQASSRLVVMVDESKVVSRLGETFALPVDVVPFGWAGHESFFESLGAEPTLRIRDGEPFRTDEGNYVVDLHFKEDLGDLWELEAALSCRVGIVETGLFLGLADEVFIGTATGVERRNFRDQT